MATSASEEKTGVGSYFISNYPPYGAWKAEFLPQAWTRLEAPPRPDTPLGLYLHIPFCRKRCKFCYFRVYTDKNSKDVERYVAALAREVELARELPVFRDRPLDFAYFGGGTPSFLSEKQLVSLVERLRVSVTWDQAREVTFECEPGTLTERKLAAIRSLGVTRLSLGVENFDDAILEANGRAHHSQEVFRAYEWARRAGFDQINVDLIAGMVGETTENWEACVTKTAELAPESVTIYQMEVPYNAVFAQGLPGGGVTVADWATKRAWVDHAFRELEARGYSVSSAYTVVKSQEHRFVYRDAVWHGADMLGTGVASFSHVSGAHYQNLDGFDAYAASIEAGALPLARAFIPSPRQLFLREIILQLKCGVIGWPYFREKFGLDPAIELAQVWGDLEEEGLAELSAGGVVLTRAGLLQVDGLLSRLFEPEHRGVRYT